MPGRPDLGRLEGEIHELIADLWQLPRIAGLRQGFRPPTDCFRKDDPPELVVVVEIAGVRPEQVEILVADGILVVSGERSRPATVEAPSYRQIEIDYGPFQRRIALDADIDPEAATAAYEDGLLTIVLPVARRKTPPGKATIQVRTRA